MGISKNVCNVVDKDSTDTLSGLYMYRSQCDCMQEDCSVTIALEVEDDLVTMNMYQSIHPADLYYGENIFASIKYRAVIALKILFGIPVLYQGTHVFRGKTHLQSFVKAILEGIEALEGKKTRRTSK